MLETGVIWAPSWVAGEAICLNLLESNLAIQIENLNKSLLVKWLIEHAYLASPLFRFLLNHQWNTKFGKCQYLGYAVTSSITTGDDSLNQNPWLIMKVGKWVREGKGKINKYCFLSNSQAVRFCSVQRKSCVNVWVFWR